MPKRGESRGGFRDAARTRQRGRREFTHRSERGAQKHAEHRSSVNRRTRGGHKRSGTGAPAMHERSFHGAKN